jgi:transcriptional regulator with XRE-family HTH domain
MSYYFVSTLPAMRLGDKIAQMRAAKGFTQVDLAAAAKCSQQTIAKIEKNNVGKPANLPNIAKALGATVEEVLDGVEPHNPKATAPRKKTHAGEVASRTPVIGATPTNPKVLQLQREWPFPGVSERVCRNLPLIVRGEIVGEIKRIIREHNEANRSIGKARG